MRTDLRCKSCQTRLSVKIELQGKFVRCPKCRNPVKVTLAPVVLPQLGMKQAAATPLMAMPVDDEAMLAKVLPDDLGDFEVLSDEEPAPPPPARKATPALVEADDEAPRSKKKKKKKKSQADESTRIPIWMWVAGGIGAVIAAGGIVFGILLALRTRTPDSMPIDWKGFALEVAILIPINIVILVAGMFISSALGGGINFGDAKTAIIGSFFLVIVVVLVSLIPIVGRYLTLIVWLVGFMTIFGLDPWEARFLFFICWILSYAANMGYAHIQHRMMEKRLERMMEDDEDDKPVKRKSRDNNKPGKKDPDDDDPDDRGYLRPGEWHDRLGDWIAAKQRVVFT
ncbi:MAG TPA: hypothetical protein PLN21_13430 [Gemmatales bacterium]|nr:hypothetical protein [Gemmatales bacterium]